MPKTTWQDRIAKAMGNLTNELRKPHTPAPFFDQGTVTNDAIEALETNFNKSAVKQEDPPDAPPRVKERSKTPRVVTNDNQQQMTEHAPSPRVVAKTMSND